MNNTFILIPAIRICRLRTLKEKKSNLSSVQLTPTVLQLLNQRLSNKLCQTEAFHQARHQTSASYLVQDPGRQLSR